jgi:hypothetical protein
MSCFFIRSLSGQVPNIVLRVSRFPGPHLHPGGIEQAHMIGDPDFVGGLDANILSQRLQYVHNGKVINDRHFFTQNRIAAAFRTKGPAMLLPHLLYDRKKTKNRLKRHILRHAA